MPFTGVHRRSGALCVCVHRGCGWAEKGSGILSLILSDEARIVTRFYPVQRNDCSLSLPLSPSVVLPPSPAAPLPSMLSLSSLMANVAQKAEALGRPHG